eukprot:5258486-Pyramimonas_sp.AAC.1
MDHGQQRGAEDKRYSDIFKHYMGENVKSTLHSGGPVSEKSKNTPDSYCKTEHPPSKNMIQNLMWVSSNRRQIPRSGAWQARAL